MKEFMLAYVVSAVASLFMVTSPAAGETWTHFTGDNVTIPEYVSDMAIDHDGVLWLGNLYGLWSYDGIDWTTWWLGKGGEWVVPFPGEDTLPSRAVNAIAVDENNVKWITITHGVISYDGNTWNFIPREETLRAITVDHDNTKWIGTLHSGVLRFDGTSWSRYTAADIGVEDHDMIWDAAVDSKNVKLFTYNEDSSYKDFGILRFDGVTWNTYVLGEVDEWNQPAVSIAADADDVIWVGTGLGVYRFENKDRITQHGYEYIVSHEGSDDAFYEIAIDPDNVKWFGTGEHGVIRYDGAAWAVYDSTNGLPDNQVLAIAIDSDNVKWFGTETGVSRLEGAPLTVEERSAPAPIAITGNYPNPFNPSTVIEFSLSNDANVVLDVYNLSGQHVATLLDDMLEAGIHSVVWNSADDAGTAVSSGVYFCRLQAEGRTAVHRMVLMR